MFPEDDLQSQRARRATLARLEADAKSDVSRAVSPALRAEPRPEPGPKIRQSGARTGPAPVAARSPRAWPIEIAFLTHYDVAPGVLSAATATAQAQNVSAEAALLAEGHVSEEHFYRALARHLRLPYLDHAVPIASAACYPQAVHAGLAPLVGGDGPAFVVAPRGAAIAHLILSAYRGELYGRLALTAPTRFAQLMHSAFRGQIQHDASLALPELDPALCAKARGPWPLSQHGPAALILAALLLAAASTAFSALPLGMIFFAVVLVRILATAAALEARVPRGRRLADRDLPIYSIVIALYREAHMVPQLFGALDKLDYPRAKLDIKFVVEEDDGATLQALRGCCRPWAQDILVAPAGVPRTKPRALNVALPLLRGQFVAVYDAEDIPEPGQIRLAAERFARAPQKLACLQARLAIGNLEAGWLPQLFAIEYAALFDVLNVGLADLRLPFPLGGSSNHFRTKILRKVGGWDAWNVTEDADIGFRLARFGYYAAALPSTTYEEAPATVKSFIGQRRRWCKGWYQTLLTLLRDPRRLRDEVGMPKAAAMVVILLSSILTPLGVPLGAVLLGMAFIGGGLSWPSSRVGVIAATLSTFVFIGGALAILAPIFFGMKRRGLLALWPKLVFLPAYYGLICFAALTSLYDLAVRPYDWCKTSHGIGRSAAPSAQLTH